MKSKLAKGSKIANRDTDRPRPQNPLQTDKPVPHHYVNHMINHATAQGFGYGMLISDMNGHRLMGHQHVMGGY